MSGHLSDVCAGMVGGAYMELGFCRRIALLVATVLEIQIVIVIVNH